MVVNTRVNGSRSATPANNANTKLPSDFIDQMIDVCDQHPELIDTAKILCSKFQNGDLKYVGQLPKELSFRDDKLHYENHNAGRTPFVDQGERNSGNGSAISSIVGDENVLDRQGNELKVTGGNTVAKFSVARHIRAAGLGPMAAMLEKDFVPDIVKDVATGLAVLKTGKMLLTPKVPLNQKLKFLVSNVIQSEMSYMTFKGKNGANSMFSQGALSVGLTLLNGGPQALISGAVNSGMSNSFSKN